MGKAVYVAPELLDRARALRAEGKSWGAIGREIGVDRDVIRWRIDPEYVARRRSDHTGTAMHFVTSYKLSPKELSNLLDTVPRDTRDFTARAMGDPLPGRSALDQKKNKLPVDGAEKTPAFVDLEKSAIHMEDRHSNSEAVE